MQKAIKIILVALLVIVTLLATLSIYVYQNVDQLKKYALKEVNEMLTAELTAESIDVTVFNTFPKVSLLLNKVAIKDPLRKESYLLQANHLFLGFDIYDVLNKRYRIQLLNLDSGELNLFTTVSGKNNFGIWKEDTKEVKGKKNFSFELNKLVLKKMRFNIDNRQNAFVSKVYLAESEFSGSFNEDRFNAEIQMSGICDLVQSGSTLLVREKTIHIKTILDVDQVKQKYSLVKGEIGINQLKLNLEGWVQSRDKEQAYQLSFKAGKTSIQDLLSTLPITLPASFLAYQSTGRVFFEGGVKGIQSATRHPNVVVNFGIEQGSLTEPDSKMKLEQINLKGSFKSDASGGLKNALVHIPSFEAKLAGSNLKGNLQISNLENPILGLEINGDADLATLQAFLKIEDVKELKGKVQFSLTLKGEKKANNWDWSSPLNKGLFSLQIDKLKLDYLNKPFEKINLQGGVNNNALQIKQCDFIIGESDFHLSGEFPTFMDFVFGKESIFTGNVAWQSSNLNVENLLIYDSSDPRETGEKPLQYKLLVKVLADKLKYEGFQANCLKGDLSLTEDHIIFQNTTLATCSGTLSGNADLYMGKNKYVLKSNNEVKAININELLKEFNNFGQNEFTSKNLFGVLQANTELWVEWDQNLNLLSEKMVVLTDMTIKNGELINYEPLGALSKFVDVNELKNLKFSELKNTLTIQNQMLQVPLMDIKNNALNLSLTGSHTFNNVVDYKVKLSLSELLSKRRKPQPNEFGEEDVKSKGINLYITIKGPIDKLQYTFDRKGAKAQLKQDVKQEKELIREIMKQELGIKKDTTLKKMEKKNEKNDELEFEPE